MRRWTRTAVTLATLAIISACAAPRPVAVQPEPTSSPAPSPTATPTIAPATPEPTPTPIAQPSDKPPVSFARADLARGSRDGVVGTGPLTLADRGLATGTYDELVTPTEIPFESGTWTSEWTPVPFAFDELVASWNADTPRGTWIRVEMQARGSGRETKLYTLMTWAATDSDIHRTSLQGQKDDDGDVDIDTFIRSRSARPLDAYRLRLTLYRRAGLGVSPSVRLVAAMASASFRFAIPSAFDGRAMDLDVPTYSQEIHKGEFPQYDDGGENWCSPTSTAMVVAYHRVGPSPDDLAAFPGSGYADPQVDHAARYTYDWNYKGAGNWPANVAYASRFGLDGFVTRLRSLSEAQLFIEAGIPLVASINGTLPGFLTGTTNGHLLVIRGFDAGGNVITNDPAVRSDREARKVYRRADFERVWLGGSAGIVYVIYPKGKTLPANVAGLPPNW